MEDETKGKGVFKEFFLKHLMDPISSQVGIVGVTLLTIIVGSVGIWLYTQDLVQLARMKVLGEGILMCGAFFCTAAVIGFLFGIPQIERGQNQASGVKVIVKENSNLGQVSDWLTKLLVGVTLAEMKSIPGLLVKAASLFPIFPIGIGVSLIMYSSAVGFLACFLTTRLYLTRELAKVEGQIG